MRKRLSIWICVTVSGTLLFLGSSCTSGTGNGPPPPSPPAPIVNGGQCTTDPNLDRDGDGVTCETDCDDSNANISPKATEQCINGADDNCDGKIDSKDVACCVPEGDAELCVAGGFTSGLHTATDRCGGSRTINCNEFSCYTTPTSYCLRNSHPRVLVTRDLLNQVKVKAVGPSAKDPYKSWFEGIRTRADQGKVHDLMNLALLYEYTGAQTYLDQYLAELNTKLDAGIAGGTVTYGGDWLIYGSMDIRWNDLTDDLKFKALRYGGLLTDVGTTNLPDLKWGYHSMETAIGFMAFAALFANEPILQSPEVTGNPTIYKFNVPNFLGTAYEELSPTGHFYRIENFLAGAFPNPNVLQGSYGGIYDNFSYELLPESHSLWLVLLAQNLSGANLADGHAHDKYRGFFFQALNVPHEHLNRTVYCATEVNYWTPTFWGPSYGWGTTGTINPGISLASTYLYKDPRIQYFVKRGGYRNECISPQSYDNVWQDLFWYDDALSPLGPDQGMPLAAYFSGPGIVEMRSSLQTDALYSVFFSSDHMENGRRAQDANSFQLMRGEYLVPNAGARARNNYDNDKHYYHVYNSWAKNTLRFMDPNATDGAPCGYSTPSNYSLTDDWSAHLGGQRCHTDESTQKIPGLTDGQYAEFADMKKFYTDTDITYALGEAAKSYNQVNYFDREYLYLRPDVIVIFDRYDVKGDNFRKSFRIHTNPKPLLAGSSTSAGNNAKTYANARSIDLAGNVSLIHMNLLYPQTNEVTIRGGDYFLVDRPLTGNLVLAPAAQSDIPRWLEIFGVGPDTTGSLTLYGQTAEALSDSETIAMGPTQRTDCAGIGPCTLGNTGKHWKRIDSINTSDLNLTRLVVSSPEYFDLDDYRGTAHTFSMHTDPAHFDSGELSYDRAGMLGRYTINIEGDRLKRAGNFLNVLHVADLGTPAIATSFVPSSAGTIAGRIRNTVVVFTATQAALDNVQFTASGVSRIYVFDCVANTGYSVNRSGDTFTIARGGNTQTSNNMGILALTP